MDENAVPPNDEDSHGYDWQPQSSAASSRQLQPTVFLCGDPSEIPKRGWMYANHLIRKYVSATIAPGGVGKSSLLITEALAIITGRDLLGVVPDERSNVWIWNGEDDTDELQRRVCAAMLHHGISTDEVEGRLFVDSGRNMPIVLAKMTPEGCKVDIAVELRLIRVIAENNIGVLIIDPFISTHQVSETTIKLTKS